MEAGLLLLDTVGFAFTEVSFFAAGLAGTDLGAEVVDELFCVLTCGLLTPDFVEAVPAVTSLGTFVFTAALLTRATTFSAFLTAETTDLPDETPIEAVRFPTRIFNALSLAGLRTLGEIRESTDKTL